MQHIKKYHGFIKESIFDDPDFKPALDGLLFNVVRSYIVENKTDLKECRKLLGMGADPNYKDKWGAAAIHYALDRPDVIELLLEFNADPDTLDRFGKTPLMRIAESFFSNIKAYYERDPAVDAWADQKRTWQQSAKLLVFAGANIFNAFKDSEDIMTFFDGDLSWMPNELKDQVLRIRKTKTLFKR